MKLSLEKEERELEEKRLMFLREKMQWEEMNRDEEEKMRMTLEKEWVFFVCLLNRIILLI